LVEEVEEEEETELVGFAEVEGELEEEGRLDLRLRRCSLAGELKLYGVISDRLFFRFFFIRSETLIESCQAEANAKLRREDFQKQEKKKKTCFDKNGRYGLKSWILIKVRRKISVKEWTKRRRRRRGRGFC
jgi:hypothetical protein